MGPAGRQVCVVGDGVDGAAAAAFLGRRGHHPTVVSPPSASAAGPHDIVLGSGVVAALRDLGGTAVADALAAGTGVRTWRVREAERERRRDLCAPDGRPPLRVVDRARIREALREGLPSARLRVSKTPTAVRSTPEGPVVEFDDGVRERFDVVVGADGRRSWVRGAAFDGAPPRGHTACGTTTWSFRLPARRSRGPTLTEAWGPDSGVILGPRERGRFVAAGDSDAASMTEAVRRSASSIPSGLDPDDVEGAARLADGGGWARRWVEGEVVLLGNAAHAFHPALPVGASLAVGDADVLAAELAARDRTAALRRYERRRRERIALLARRVAAGGSRSSPFPVGGLPGLQDIRRGLLGAARGTGPDPLSTAVSGRS
ncbi:MAG: FAD-dependent oxidoreductase [Haloferacaceae archaeon]